MNNGGNLQQALNAAQPGDVIQLAAGATFTGNFILPAKSGSSQIWVRSSAYNTTLPAVGTRVAPSNASSMAKIVTTNSQPALISDYASNGWYFTGLEITTTWAVNNNTQFGLVLFGYDVTGNVAATTLGQLPTNVVFDRCYLHGTSTGNVRRGIGFNVAIGGIVDSYFSDFHEVGADSQAVAAWNGPGPFKIQNNYLEGAAENLLFGGADPAIHNLVPSDITISGNYFYKPLTWKFGDPTYAGIHWAIKNLQELKNSQRVLATGNIYEHVWGDAQTGFAILFTPRNQNGTAPWSVVQDITFTNNIVRHVGSGINVSGTDDVNPSQRTARVSISNNLLFDVNGTTWSADGRLFQVLGGANYVTFNHNTGNETGVIMLADGSPANQGFIYTNNISAPGSFGFIGSNQGEGNNAIAFYFPGAVFTKNVLTGRSAIVYSNYAGNFFPATMADVGFVNLAANNYTLLSSSPYHNAATDGTDIGVNTSLLPSG